MHKTLEFPFNAELIWYLFDVKWFHVAATWINEVYSPTADLKVSIYTKSLYSNFVFCIICAHTRWGVLHPCLALPVFSVCSPHVLSSSVTSYKHFVFLIWAPSRPISISRALQSGTSKRKKPFDLIKGAVLSFSLTEQFVDSRFLIHCRSFRENTWRWRRCFCVFESLMRLVMLVCNV